VITELIDLISISFPKSKLICGLDKNCQFYVYFSDIDCLYKKRYLTPTTGRGDSFDEALIDLCNQLMNKEYTIRYKTRFYATKNIRKAIRKSKILEVNLCTKQT